LDVFYSTQPHARIRKLDLRKARQHPGVAEVFTAKDFHDNLWGSIIKEQPLLADQEVRFVGEAIAVIAADSPVAAREARDKIEVVYEDLPAILSVSEAKKKQSYIG